MRDELEIDINLLKSVQETSTKNLISGLLSTAIASILIYSITFSGFYFISKKGFYFASEYFTALGLFVLSVTFGASLSRKLSLTKQDKSEKILKTLYLSTLISLFFLIILSLALQINNINRAYILSSMFIGLIIESFYFLISTKNRKSNFSLVENIKLFAEQIKLSVVFIFLDGLILTLFCYIEIVNNIIPGVYKEKEFILIGLVYLSWIISASATHKFVPSIVATSRMNAFEMQVKFYLQIIAMVVLSMIFLQIELYKANHFIEALAGYSLLSSLLFMFLFADKIKNKTDEATIVFLKAYELKDSVISSNDKNRNGKYGFNNSKVMESVVNQKLEFEYLKEHGEVFLVLDTMLNLKSFDTRRTLIINSEEPNDISSKPADSYQLVVNLHVLNDQINLNDYLLNVRKTLVDGGVFVGALLPHHYRYRRYLKKYSFGIANTLYFFDFIWKRVFPKLPITREIYIAFSKEKDRAISLAEGLGRLVYCGLKILDLAVVDDVVYFAAIKDKVLAPANKFFYSPIFKMKRIGKNGKEINVYKLRTMYPYAEYLQDYILQMNGYSEIGKPAKDFRLPIWGNVFRKYWLDEIPQLLNVFKGEMKLVGARPLSKKVYNDYPADLKELRNKYKPGCVPPYVSLMKQSMDGSIEAERIYLKDKEKHPFATDFKYFFKAIYNILTNKIRSA